MMMRLLVLFIISGFACSNVFAQQKGNVTVTSNASAATIDEVAQFPGGSEGMMKYLRANVKYPPEAVKKGIQGIVYVKFAIDVTGKVTEVEVQRTVHPLLDAEAERVVKAMPKWKPAMNKGVPVKMQALLPVSFRL